MKKFICHALWIISAPCSFATFATTINFSPYADLTINARWDSTYQDMEPMDLLKISQESGIKSYHLAFITDAGNCQPAWGAESSYGVHQLWGKHLADKLQAAHISTIVSFGGANGNDVSMACSEDQLIALFDKVMTAYQPIGLDFDIENGTAQVEKLVNALIKTQTKYPLKKLSFTLPVMPEGLTYQGESIIKEAMRKRGDQTLIFTVNIMAMDYGSAYNGDMGQYAISAANNVFNFIKRIATEKSDKDIWQMIEVTPMIGVNDVNILQFTLTNVDTLRDFAQQKALGGLSMWSVARDRPCSDKWA